jgi:hypothetical protein
MYLKDFGIDVKYTIQNGVPKTIRGIFDNQFIDVETGGDVGFAIQQLYAPGTKPDSFSR